MEWEKKGAPVVISILGMKNSTYLEDGQRFSMGDAFQTFAVNGKNPVAFLDAPVSIGHAATNHLVNLSINFFHHRNHFKEKKIDQALSIHCLNMSENER